MEAEEGFVINVEFNRELLGKKVRQLLKMNSGVRKSHLLLRTDSISMNCQHKKWCFTII